MIHNKIYYLFSFTLLPFLYCWLAARAGPQDLTWRQERVKEAPRADIVIPTQTWHRSTTQLGLQLSGSPIPTVAFLLFLEHIEPDPVLALFISSCLSQAHSSLDSLGSLSHFLQAFLKCYLTSSVNHPELQCVHTNSFYPAPFFPSSNILYNLFNKNISSVGRAFIFCFLMFHTHLDEGLAYK